MTEMLHAERRAAVTTPDVNSPEWWERYFHEGQWEAHDGRGQTLSFMQALIAALPSEERAYLLHEPVRILDWGCAMGEGTALLAENFPRAKVMGLDISESAIGAARLRHPECDFVVTDGRIPDDFDVIVTSNCLEHFPHPLQIVGKHLASCRHLYLALVPYNESPLIAEHRAQFREESFPTQVGDFTRIGIKVLDVDQQFWRGQQLLAIYGSPAYLASRAERIACQQADESGLSFEDAERLKWDTFYASLPDIVEDPLVRAFGAEFAQVVAELVPNGGATLEAGSGAGWQSLALARTGKFMPSLLDFSAEALAYARKLYHREGVSAHFVQESVFHAGTPDYDLVFNAGVLEHYTHSEQVAFLRGMASRTREYVLVLVPNKACYWYWLWRMQKTRLGQWPYGKEMPVTDLAAAFEDAGLEYLGRTFVGEGWTESFIAGVEGLSPTLANEICEIHSSRLDIPDEQKSYLVAFLGTVKRGDRKAPVRWTRAHEHESMAIAEINAALADALSMRIGAEARLVEQELHIHDQDKHINRLERDVEEANAERQRLELVVTQRDATIRAGEERTRAAKQRVDVLDQALSSTTAQRDILKAQAEDYHAQLTTYYASRAWRWSLRYWKMREDGLVGVVRMFFVVLWALVKFILLLPYHIVHLLYHLVVPRKVRVRYWEHRYFRKHPGLKALANPEAAGQSAAVRTKARADHDISKTLPHVFIFSGVPYHDIGGGQRPAQLANTFNRMGHAVTFIYAYDSSDLGKKVAFTPAIRHVGLANTSPAELIRDLRGEPVFIFELPATGFVPYLELGKKIGARTVYEHIDNWDTSLGTYLAYTRESLCTFIREADVVTVTARPLEDKLRELIDGEPDLRAMNREIQYCANAVNVELFDPAVKHKAPADLVRGASKTLLYYGSLWGEWFDWDLIRAVGRGCPECAINLIGDDAQLASIKPTLPRNVHFLGPKLQTELPGYLEHVDVTLLPFKNDEIGRYVSPLKIFEYLSMGKPILATSLPDIAGYPNLFQSDDPEVWVHYVQGTVPADGEAGRDFAMHNSWYSRCSNLLDWCGIETTNLRPSSVSVIVLNRNNRSVIARCIDNLLAYRSTYGYDIIVVDNQSTDGSPEMLRERYGDRITLLLNDRNGCSSGRNLGMHAARGEYVLFLDSDQWPISGRWLEAPLAVLHNRRNVGAAGWIGGWASTEWRGGVVSTSLPHLGIEADVLARTDPWYLGSGGLLARREVLELVGGFDVSYDPTCYEDTDLSLAIRDAGFELAYCPYMTIQHLPHQTTNAGSAEHQRLMERNGAYFRSKWSSRAPRLLTDQPFPAE